MLSQEDERAYEQIWVNDLQLRLAQLSKRGRRVMVENSGQDMPTDRPDAIVTAVRELCETSLLDRLSRNECEQKTDDLGLVAVNLGTFSRSVG
jgi:hypothetical protein